MIEEFKEEDGSELTFNSDGFAERLQPLMCLFSQFGVTSEKDFESILGDDWTLEHYCKLLAEMQKIRAVDKFGMAVSPDCERVLKEIRMIRACDFYV